MSDTDESESRVPGGRIRRSTIERFNDELSVLDRPLESEAEFYEDPPRRSPWKRVGMVAGAAALLGGLGVLSLARVSSTSSESDGPKLAVALLPSAAVTTAMAAPSSAPSVAPPEAAPPTVAVVTPPATLPPVAAEVEAEPETAPAGDAGPSRLQPSRRAWANIRPAAPTSKPVSAPPHKSGRHGRHR